LEILLLIVEILLEVFLEAILELLAEVVGSLVLHAFAAFFETPEFQNPVLAFIVYLLFGAAAGGLSLQVLPHPLVHPSRFPGLSVILSPILAGLGMAWVGTTLRRRNKKAMQIEGFVCGFAFAFGLALVRFIFTRPS